MTDTELLFKNLRWKGFDYLHRSERFMAFVRSQKHEGTFHHLLPAVHSKKNTDLFGICLTGKEHSLLQDDHTFNIDSMAEAIINDWKYIIHLEGKH